MRFRLTASAFHPERTIAMSGPGPGDARSSLTARSRRLRANMRSIRTGAGEACGYPQTPLARGVS